MGEKILILILLLIQQFNLLLIFPLLVLYHIITHHYTVKSNRDVIYGHHTKNGCQPPTDPTDENHSNHQQCPTHPIFHNSSLIKINNINISSPIVYKFLHFPHRKDLNTCFHRTSYQKYDSNPYHHVLYKMDIFDCT